MLEKVTKYLATAIVSGMSAVLTVGITIGVLKSDVSALQLKDARRDEVAHMSEARVLDAIGDLKKEMGEDIGGLKAEIQHLKETVKKGQ